MATLFGYPVKVVDKIAGIPDNPELKFGLPIYDPPFENAAAIVIHGQDYAHAEWVGDKSWPVPFSYIMLHAVEFMPWKLREVKDEPHVQRKWFVRDEE